MPGTNYGRAGIPDTILVWFWLEAYAAIQICCSPPQAAVGASHRLLIALPFLLPGFQFPYSYLLSEFRQKTWS